jgi:hypothetical protein
MSKHVFNTRSRFLSGIGSLFLVCALLLAGCGGDTLQNASTPAPSFASQADAFLSQEVANRLFSGVVLVS